MDFKKEIILLLAKSTKLPVPEIEPLISAPPDSKLGDYAFSCFKLGGNPKEAALRLKEKIKLPKFLAKLEVVGPYLNFFVDKTTLAETVLTEIKQQKANYGKNGKNNAGKKIVLEYCGPNTNKPLHLGHMRNMALGSAMVNLLDFQGNKVSPVNIVNDRGIHICQSMVAYQKWGKDKQPDKKGDHFVGDYYVLFAQKNKEQPELMKEAQELLYQWEMKNSKVLKLWKKMNSWVLNGFKETYQRFGIAFDREYYESELYESGKKVVFAGLKKRVFVKDDNKNIVAPLESYGLPNKVVLRCDGTSVYITQDLYLAEQRYKDYKYDQSLYVVASEQNLHFRQLFKIIELLQKPFAGKLYHLGYGLVHLPSGRMKSREGTVIDADDLMDEISSLALKEVNERYPNLSQKEREDRAEKIGLAAIKFYMLKTDPVRDIVFNPEESLKFEGETGPYLQYTYARASSVLRKAGKVLGKLNYSKLDYSKLAEINEHNLILLLSKFPEQIRDAAQQYKPHLLCRYLLDLAQQFNEFYHARKIISDDEKLMKTRLELASAVRQVLSLGLGLLGIKVLEEM